MPVPPWPGDRSSASPAPGEPNPTSPVFTLAAATRLLPYLRTTLAAAQTHVSEMRALVRAMRRMEAVGRTPAGTLILAADHAAVQRHIAEHRAECELLLQQIAVHGCQVKDLAAGLCDFPAVIQGRPALLCWRMDEQSIAYYHGESDGYTGRKPIPPGTP